MARQNLNPAADQPLDPMQVQLFINCGIPAQITGRQVEQGNRRFWTLFLEVNKSAGQLNQSLVKEILWLPALSQPKLLQDLVGLKKKLPVKALEIGQVMRVESSAARGFDQRGDFAALLAQARRHQRTIPGCGQIDNQSPLRHSGRMAKPALGRGLGALLGGHSVTKPPVPAADPTAIPQPASPAAEPRDSVKRVALDRIVPCPFQPRKDFAPETLRELADSIKEQGIVQPLIVRERNGHLELIAGERRWRAAQLAGLGEVPVILRQADDRAVLELALIENLQRENLNPIEEAQGYAQLSEQFQLTQEDVAAKVGKSRAVVANALRLLKLATELQAYLRDGRLSVGHAKAILGLADEKQQRHAAARVLKDGLNVRQTETLVNHLQSREQPHSAKGMPVAAQNRDAHVLSLENRLRERLGTKIHLRYAQGKGALEITFFSEAELERILQILGLPPD